MDRIPQVVKNYMDEIANVSQLGDITPSLADMRMDKASKKLQVARHAGMVFAVDGSVSLAGVFRAEVGDSFIITEDGYEQITNHPKTLESVIV